MKFVQALIGPPAADYVGLAIAAEEAGFDGCAVSDHVVYPADLGSKYPYTADGVPQYEPTWDFPDPWVAISAMAAATNRLEFLTNVFVLPLRNPFVVAKQLATLTAIHGERCSLGVGAGWMSEEFDLLEQSFAARGRRMDEMIEVMRTLWAGGFVEHHGEFYDFDPVDMRPAPPAPLPVLVGGHSEIALRRAVRNDGWIGVNYPLEQLVAYCSRLERMREEVGDAERPFRIVGSPLATPTAETIETLEEAGVTTLLTSAWVAAGHRTPDSLEHARDLMGRYADKYIRPHRD